MDASMRPRGIPAENLKEELKDIMIDLLQSGRGEYPRKTHHQPVRFRYQLTLQ